MSSKSNTKRTRSSNAVSLKQGILAFPATKRTSSSASSTLKAKKPATRTTSAPVKTDSSSSTGSSSVGSPTGEERIEQSSSDEFVNAPAVSSSKQKTSKRLNKGKVPLRSRGNTVAAGEIDLRAANPAKWRKHYGEVWEKMGNLEPSEFYIHMAVLDANVFS